MPLFYYSRLTEGAEAQVDLQDPESEEKRSPVEPHSPGWLHDSLTAHSPPLPLPLTDKQWRRWIMRCWPWSKLSGYTVHTGNLHSLLLPNKFGYLQTTAVGFADADGEYEWLWSWGGCGGGKRGFIASLPSLRQEKCWPCSIKDWP